MVINDTQRVKQKKIIAIMLLSIFLVFCIEGYVFEAHALAITATVLWVAVVCIVAGAVGISLVCSQGMSKGQQEQFFSAKFNEWQTATGGGLSLQGFFERFSSSVTLSSAPSVQSLGSKLFLGVELYNFVKSFLQWLTTSMGASTDTSTDWATTAGNFGGSIITMVGDIPATNPPVSVQISNRYYNFIYGFDGFLCYPSDSTKLMIVMRYTYTGSPQLYTETRRLEDNSLAGRGYQSYLHYSGSIWYLLWDNVDTSQYYNSDTTKFLDWPALKSEYTISDVLDYVSTSDDFTAVETGTTITAIPSTGALDYVDTSTGVVDIPIDTSIPWTAEGTLDTVLTDATDMALDNTLVSTYDESISADPGAGGGGIVATNGLQSVFPFSVPFTVYYGLKLFYAEPQTPVFDINVDLVYAQFVYTIDLHMFDEIAALSRRLIVIVYAIGLAANTRKYIKW